MRIQIGDIADGDYWLYARDDMETLSGPVDLYIRHAGILMQEALEARVYPNPLKERTSIEFHLESHKHVSLSIVDESGRTLAVLHDGNLEAGEHSFTWKPECAPGSYFFLLEAGEAQIVKKLIKL